MISFSEARSLQTFLYTAFRHSALNAPPLTLKPQTWQMAALRFCQRLLPVKAELFLRATKYLLIGGHWILGFSLYYSRVFTLHYIKYWVTFFKQHSNI